MRISMMRMMLCDQNILYRSTLRRFAVRVPRMRRPPRPDPLAMLGSFSVAAPQVRACPAALTGLLAGRLTGRERTILLMPAVAGIGLIQLSTVAALAPSSSLHESLRNEARIMRRSPQTCRKKTQSEEEEKTAEEDILNRMD